MDTSDLPTRALAVVGGAPDLGENRVSRIIGDAVPANLDPFGRPRRPKVAILGFTDHKLQAPFHDPEFEIWGLNELYRYIVPPHVPNELVSRCTRWFEIHPRSWFEKADPDHIKGMAALPVPVYMQDHYDDIPPSVRFPKELVEQFSGDYQTSSISWMLGLAIAENYRNVEGGFREIHVYGVDMAQDTEYVEQRPACEHLLGLAKGLGIKVYVPPTSDLLKAIGQYAFGTQGDVFSAKLEERLAWLNREHESFAERIRAIDAEYKAKSEGLTAEYQGKRDGFLTNLKQLEGAIDDCRYWKRSFAVRNGGKPDVAPNPDRTLDPMTAIQRPAVTISGPVPVTPGADGR